MAPYRFAPRYSRGRGRQQGQQINGTLQQLLQSLLRLHYGEGAEGIELTPHIPIAACRPGHVTGSGTKQADALELVALLPIALL